VSSAHHLPIGLRLQERGARAASSLLLAAACALSGGCALWTPGLTPLLERPAERALMDGMRAYDDASYPRAERELTSALQHGLRHPRDRATAHKLLAFVQCTTQRVTACEQSFRDARAADPQFELTRAEVGHPLWGPVYRRVTTAP
jgi:hypothetical protein